MANMKPPKIPEAPPDVLTDEQIKKLLKGCEGRDFRARRDTAIIRLLTDNGMRLAEMAGLKVEDIDLDPPASFPAHVCSSMAGRRRARGRSDATSRLAFPNDAWTLWRFRCP